MGKFVVAGITQVETIVRVNKVPIEYAPLTTEINSIYTGLGGDAYNERVALRALGDEVEFMSIIGRDKSVEDLNPPGTNIELSTKYVVQMMEEVLLAVQVAAMAAQAAVTERAVMVKQLIRLIQKKLIQKIQL